MLIFELIIWVLFGITMGGLVAFFMEKRGHSWSYAMAGVAGAVVGGVVGMYVGTAAPALEWTINGFSLTRLICALVFAIFAALIDRFAWRRGRPFVQDPRPGVP